MSQDDEKTEEALNEIQKWISEHSEINIPEDFTGKKFLKRFFFGCKHDVQKTIKTYENYCKIRKTHASFFRNRDPCGENLEQSYNTVYMFTLPDLTEEGYRVSFCGLLLPDVNKFSAMDMAIRSLMHFDIRLQEECLEDNNKVYTGDIYVMDLGLFTFSHLSQYSYSFMKSSVECQLNSMPFRVKGIHFLNSPSFVGLFIKIFKVFLSNKLKKRIHVHSSDYTTLHDYIPKKILPQDFEGEGHSIKHYNDAWRDKLVRNRDWFLQEDE